MVFTIFAVRKNSPLSGCPSILVAIVSDKSPFATAPITRAISLVGRTRSSIKTLTHPMASAQQLDTLFSDARSVIRPSFPTTCTIRSNSCVMRSLVSMTVLNVSAIFPDKPVQSSGRRAEKSPRLKAINAASNCLVSNSFPLGCEGFRGRVLVDRVFFIE